MPLILASSSPIRRSLLDQAGLPFSVQPPGVDESAEKASFEGDPAGLAEHLARVKALSVSATAPGWVIGSDSVVVVDGRQFDKPSSKDQAAEHLRFFSGKPLELTSAAALARDGRVDWSFAGRTILQVRQLSDSFIADYLDAEWPEVSYCVGVFRLEGLGVQLFERIDGSHFTILGLPLLPLLGALRDRGMAPS